MRVRVRGLEVEGAFLQSRRHRVAIIHGPRDGREVHGRALRRRVCTIASVLM